MFSRQDGTPLGGTAFALSAKRVKAFFFLIRVRILGLLGLSSASSISIASTFNKAFLPALLILSTASWPKLRISNAPFSDLIGWPFSSTSKTTLLSMIWYSLALPKAMMLNNRPVFIRTSVPMCWTAANLDWAICSFTKPSSGFRGPLKCLPVKLEKGTLSELELSPEVIWGLTIGPLRIIK